MIYEMLKSEQKIKWHWNIPSSCLDRFEWEYHKWWLFYNQCFLWNEI